MPKTAKAAPKEKKDGKEVGKVSGYYTHVKVASMVLTSGLKVGDKIRIKGHTTDFGQKVSSMQIDGKSVDSAKKGEHVGIKVSDRVRPNDKVFLE